MRNTLLLRETWYQYRAIPAIQWRGGVRRSSVPGGVVGLDGVQIIGDLERTSFQGHRNRTHTVMRDN